VAVPFYTRFLRQGRFDLVNIYYADCGEATPIRRTKKSYGFQLQFIAGYPPDLVPHRFDAFDRLGLTRLVDRVVAKSPAMVAPIEDRLGRPTVMIPNGVDSEHFAPSQTTRDLARNDLGIDSDEKVIVSVAALEERKGVQFVLRAMPRLLEHFGRVQYLIAGEGRFRSRLEAEADRLELGSNVRFLGAVEDVRPLFSSADLMALLSHGEGFPNVLLEAWSMDLPVIVSDHPPYPDLVSGDLGVRVDEGVPVEVANGIIQLLEAGYDHAKGARRQHVKENYSWSKISERIAFLAEH
jgi:glycosyltransferase involved in cell wall biosynthesis